MLIVKIGGGSAIDHAAIAEDLAGMEGPMVVVHGANAKRDALASQLGVDKQVVTSLSGYDSVLADEASMDVMMMAYSGLINKRLVAELQKQGVNAVGLSGIDGRLVVGRRNRGIKTRRNGKKVVLRDLSGKPAELNVHLLRTLLDAGYVPVITMPIVDENGVPISSENDDVVALLQEALEANRVVQLIEANGLMRDIADPNSVIDRLSVTELQDWQNRVEGRMKRKLLSLSKLFSHGRPAVYIADGRSQAPVSGAFAGRGTCIQH